MFANDITLGNAEVRLLLDQYEELLIALFGKCYIDLELMINFTKPVRLTPQQLSYNIVAGYPVRLIWSWPDHFFSR